MVLVVCVVAVVVALASYLTWLAGRLDRLAIRVDAARAGLDARLVRRAAAAEALGRRHDLPDLVAAAVTALTADDAGREDAENALGKVLRPAMAALTAAGQEADLAEVGPASARVHLARQFHNDAVRDLLALRGALLVRWLHLYGHARPPVYFEIDDEPPRRPGVG